MKKAILSIITIINFFSLSAQDVEDNLYSAFKAFENKEYQLAIEKYLSVANDASSPSLYHNLALSYYYEGNLGKSILFMEKAKKLKPLDKDINKNLKLLNENVDTEIQNLPPFFLKSWINSSSSIMNPTLWVVLHLIFLMAAIVFLYFYLIKNYDLGGLHFYYIRGVIIGLGVISLLCAGLGYNAQSLKSDQSAAIVLQENTVLRAGAEGNSVENAKLPEGLKVNVQDTIGDFYKVRLGDFTEGWVEKSAVRFI